MMQLRRPIEREKAGWIDPIDQFFHRKLDIIAELFVDIPARRASYAAWSAELAKLIGRIFTVRPMAGRDRRQDRRAVVVLVGHPVFNPLVRDPRLHRHRRRQAHPERRASGTTNASEVSTLASNSRLPRSFHDPLHEANGHTMFAPLPIRERDRPIAAANFNEKADFVPDCAVPELPSRSRIAHFVYALPPLQRCAAHRYRRNGGTDAISTIIGKSVGCKSIFRSRPMLRTISSIKPRVSSSKRPEWPTLRPIEPGHPRPTKIVPPNLPTVATTTTSPQISHSSSPETRPISVHAGGRRRTRGASKNAVIVSSSLWMNRGATLPIVQVDDRAEENAPKIARDADRLGRQSADKQRSHEHQARQPAGEAGQRSSARANQRMASGRNDENHQRDM